MRGVTRGTARRPRGAHRIGSQSNCRAKGRCNRSRWQSGLPCHLVICRRLLSPQAAGTAGQYGNEPDGEMTADGGSRARHMSLRPHLRRRATEGAALLIPRHEAAPVRAGLAETEGHGNWWSRCGRAGPVCHARARCRPRRGQGRSGSARKHMIRMSSFTAACGSAFTPDRTPSTGRGSYGLSGTLWQ
jgi:hypothetical protein